MQRVEANRHRAEQLEAAALTADSAFTSLMARIAVQRREIADQFYALFLGEGAKPVSPLQP
jgi:TorA maturation chaperone TorD